MSLEKAKEQKYGNKTKMHRIEKRKYCWIERKKIVISSMIVPQ